MAKDNPTFKLSNLKTLASEISPVQCDYYAEACSVALQKNNHENPKFTVDGDFNGSFLISRNHVTKLEGWQDDFDVAEYGALAIAFFVIDAYSEYTVVRQSKRGTGFDYWLGYKRDDKKFDAKNFLLARLEVSGIFKGGDPEIKKRAQIKVNQIKKSGNLGLPAYISVTEFSNCKSRLLQHEQSA
jgi:hypothetical protein